MKIRMLCAPAFAGLAVAATADTASAGFLTFNSIDSFLAEGPSMVNHDVSGFAVNNAFHQFQSLQLGTLTISTDNVSLSIWDEEIGMAFATNGDQYIHVASNAMLVTFTFDMPIVRFGLHISDWGDHGTGSLWYTDDIGNHTTIATTTQANGNLMFFGIESDTGISQLSFHRDNLADGFGLDNIFYEFAVVPAPGALALLGIAGLVGASRRRRA